MEALALGFVLGILASIAAAWVVEYGARPSIVIEKAPVWGIQSQHPGPPGPVGVLFFHVQVRNVRRSLAPIGPRPAWAAHAALEVEAEGGSLKVGPIDGRWSAHPEPVLPAAANNQTLLLLDPAKILEGRTIDVHGHAPLELCALLKVAGEDDCYLFNNSSYPYPQWKNPAWRLPPGAYRLRIAVSYESGTATAILRFQNPGQSSSGLVLLGVTKS